MMPLLIRSTRRAGRMRMPNRADQQDPRCNTGSRRVKSNAVVRCQMEIHSRPQLHTTTRRQLPLERVQLELQCLKARVPKKLNRPKGWNTRNKFVRASLSKSCKHSQATRRLDSQSRVRKSCLASRLFLLSGSEKN